MTNFQTLPPLSLYVHIPWCIQKCPYCDFNSHAVREQIPEQAYIDAMIRDLEQELPEVWGRRVGSIFIGGGTPSTFSPQGIAQLLQSIKARITVSPNAEITMEINPGTVDIERIAGFYDAGINRLSIGIQSFDNTLLKRIGRIHDQRQAITAFEAARECGFENINVDLMFALPGQSIEVASKDMQTAVQLGPEHVSYYHLTIEPNTAFHHNPPQVPDDDLAWEIQQTGQDILSLAGYRQYEISAYAQAGRQSRHNVNYWQFGDYLGIGAGAHGKITRADTGSIQRRWKEKHPAHYMSKLHGGGDYLQIQTLDQENIVIEFLMNVLRLDEGFQTDLFEQRTGLNNKLLFDKLTTAFDKGLVEHLESEGRIHPTERGKAFLNELLLSIID